MRFLHYCVTEEDDNKRLDSVLKQRLAASSTLIKLNKERGGNRINGGAANANARVQAGDKVSLLIDDAITEALTPCEDISTTVYEDDYLMVIDKPTGVSVHPAPLIETPTLANMLAARFSAGQGFHAVNRLDKGTSGLMVVAKFGHIHSCLISQLHTDAFMREYAAITLGCPAMLSGKIEIGIDREPGSAIKRRVSQEGAYALTSYEVLMQGDLSLVRLIAHTGRTHQLRLHMSHIGCPLAGDFLYGVEDKSLIARPALHSRFLSFIHPITGAELCFSCELPEDMRRLIKGGTCNF